jgi:hypothetical protein
MSTKLSYIQDYKRYQNVDSFGNRVLSTVRANLMDSTRFAAETQTSETYIVRQGTVLNGQDSSGVRVFGGRKGEGRYTINQRQMTLLANSAFLLTPFINSSGGPLTLPGQFGFFKQLYDTAAIETPGLGWTNATYPFGSDGCEFVTTKDAGLYGVNFYAELNLPITDVSVEFDVEIWIGETEPTTKVYSYHTLVAAGTESVRTDTTVGVDPPPYSISFSTPMYISDTNRLFFKVANVTLGGNGIFDLGVVACKVTMIDCV